MTGEQWEDMAECARHPELSWFPGEDAGRGGNTSYAMRELSDRAKGICISECPVNVDCIAFAFDTGSVAGIWGGIRANDATWKRLRRMYRRGDDWMAAYFRETGQVGLFERRTG